MSLAPDADLPTTALTRMERPPEPLFNLPQDVPEESPARLAARIADAVWRGLPFTPRSAPTSQATDATPWIEAYLQSFDQVRQAQRDVQRLIQTVCKTNLMSWQEAGPTQARARDERVDQRLHELLQSVQTALTEPRNVLTAQNVTQTPVELAITLRDALRATVDQFGRELVALLQQGVTDCFLGRLVWTAPGACHYVYFRNIVAQRNLPPLLLKTRHFVPLFGLEGLAAPGRAPLTFGKWVTTVRAQERLDHRLLIMVHDYHGTHAAQRSLPNSQVLRPPAIEPVVAAIPTWLNEFVHVVETQLIQERLEVADLTTETRYAPQRTEQSTWRSELVLSLGPFVLTGWGQAEIDAEQRRRDMAAQTVRDQVARQEVVGWSWLTGVLLTASAGCYAAALWGWPALHGWFVVALGLGVLTATQVARIRREWGGGTLTMSLLVQVALMIAVPMGVVCWCLASLRVGAWGQALLSAFIALVMGTMLGETLQAGTLWKPPARESNSPPSRKER